MSGGGRAPSGKGGDGGKKSTGGLWGVFSKLLDNVSFDVNIGSGAPAPRAPSGNPADPAARMEPVKQDRKETYDEMLYRTTDGERGRAPNDRVDRERQFVARSLDARGAAASTRATIPNSGGESLSKDVRSRMEPRLGADLSDVRLHRSGESAEAAQNLKARAFTVGGDVHFGSGQYQPGTKEGDRLLAHELTHVVQGKQSGIQRKADEHKDEQEADQHQVSDPNEPAEKEADAKGDEVADSLHGGEVADKQGAAAMPAQRPAPVSAKYVGVGRKIHRKAPSANSSGGKPTPTEKAESNVTLADACAHDPGIAKQKYQDVMGEGAPRAVAKRDQFIKGATARLKKNPKDPLSAMRQEAEDQQYLCLGIKVSEDALVQGGGVSRVLDLPSLFTRGYLAPSFMAAFAPTGADAFVDQARQGNFDPNKHLDDAKELRGKVAETWWFPSNGANAVNLEKLRHELYIQTDVNYAKGAVRLDMPPAELKAHKIDMFKPTAFDGLHQGGGNDAWWRSSNDPNWGLTKNGTKEAVMPSQLVGKFKHRTLMMPTETAKAPADAKSKKSKAT